jgi:cyclopropane-fatty-acyl-phospholipid synthase
VRDYVTDVQREYKTKEAERLKVLEPARELMPA